MIVELRSSADPRFPLLLDLAHRLFKSDVLEPDAFLREELDRRPEVIRYLVWEEDGVRGFCRTARLSVGTLVVHLGADPAWQGRGVGSRLLDAAREASDGLPIFAEVEEGPSYAWWLARGAKVVESAYAQPSLRPETPPVPMTLMALGEVENPQAGVHAIYREFYGRAEDDPLLLRILAEVAA